MNFENKFKSLEREMGLLSSQLKGLKDEFESARDFTSIFLQCCEKHGVKTVSIATKTDLLEGCKNWPFGFEGSVFADELEGTWPAIWAVAEEMKIYGGCGNTGQAQANCSRLINGVYRLENNKWIRLEDER